VEAHADLLPGLTPQQEHFARSVGAGAQQVLRTMLPGRIFVYVEEPGRTVRHEIDDLGHVLRSDSFPRG
jgi:hypothetical protein